GSEVNNIDGLMLFSGALALSDNAESMSRIWGIKLLARIIDGTYQTHGPNPYKYPNVAGLAGLELMDLINIIRDKVEEGQQIEV
ncbi:MAG TPA: phospholipase, partial [Alteromonas macleodii]|nr:phospholipase [Alteromonas macleodii]